MVASKIELILFLGSLEGDLKADVLCPIFFSKMYLGKAYYYANLIRYTLFNLLSHHLVFALKLKLAINRPDSTVRC